MNTAEMTVHEALCEIKVLDSRLIKALNEAEFINTRKGSSTRIEGVTVNEYEERVKASYNRVNDLIRRSEAIKAALSLSNASTKVRIGGKEMTVAEAIYLYQHGIALKKRMLAVMEGQYRRAVDMVNDRNGDHLDRGLSKYLTDNFGAKDKTDPEALQKATEQYIANNTYVLVDPLKLKESIETLRDEIDGFMSEADSALQVSNAVTKITVSF